MWPDFETYSAFSTTHLSNWPPSRSNPSSSHDCTSCRRESATSDPRTRSEPHAGENDPVRRVRPGRHLGPQRAPGAGPESSRQGEELARLLRGLRPGRALHPIVRKPLALHNTGADVEIWSGRSDEVKDQTTAWLTDHGLGHIPIRTRPRATADPRAQRSRIHGGPADVRNERQRGR